MLRVLTHAIMPFAALGMVASGFAAPAASQQNSQVCINQGHKPGSNGFFRCLQSLQDSGTDSSAKEGLSGTAGSAASSSSDGVLTGYSGGPIEGATDPDPDLLKQLGKDDLTPSNPGGGKP